MPGGQREELRPWQRSLVASAEIVLIEPGGENLLDFLELRQVLSTYDGRKLCKTVSIAYILQMGIIKAHTS